MFKELTSDINSPWALLGEFNSTLHVHEMCGGVVNPSLRGILGFQKVLNGCELIDAGFQGYPFTRKRGNLEQRLDKMLINLQWRLLFQDAIVLHLSPFKSDHRPLLVKFCANYSKNSHRRGLFTFWPLG